MIISGQVGPQTAVAAGATLVPYRQGRQADMTVSELHGRYYEQTYAGNVYSLSVAAAAAITAYTGGAAGTPQIALWNPAGSGKNAVILQASLANVVAASAAGTVAWGLYFGVTAAITQATTTVPTNMLTLQKSGSAMTGFTNVALTSSTALTNVLPLSSYYWATAAGAINAAPPVAEIAGSIIIPPGCMIALGGSSALTSATWIGGLVWEETPV